MRDLEIAELAEVQGGKHKPSIFNVVGGALIGGIAGAFVGFMTAGPPGALAGLGVGLYDGAATAIIAEGANALADR